MPFTTLSQLSSNVKRRRGRGRGEATGKPLTPVPPAGVLEIEQESVWSVRPSARAGVLADDAETVLK